MRVSAIQVTVLVAQLLAVGPGCSRGISAEVESKPGTGGQDTLPADSIATNPAQDAPPVARPEPAPAALEFPSATPALLTTNDALEGVVRQLRAGVEETVLLTYISNSSKPFNVGSEEIIYLTDLGAPGHVINAMMDRDQQLQSGSAPTASSAEPWPPAGTVAQVPATSLPSDDGAAPPAPEEEAVVIDPPAEEMSVDYFYEYLAPYGNWVDIPGYGLCWQPGAGVVTTGWMPYGDRGRWVYTNYGWYWYSDYTWGWATFHYGRWLHNSRWGWCWVPGTVWGPSWVSWRYYDSYCGWAPLPPYSSSGFYFSVGVSWGIPYWCYTYVPVYNVCTYFPRRCAVPYAQAQWIHGRARAYDHYSVGRDNVIRNRGIPPETLAGNSRTEIQRAQIRERSELPAGTARRERLENDGRTLTVYRPGDPTRVGTDVSQARSGNQTRPASRDLRENPGSGRILGGRTANPTTRSGLQSTTTTARRPTRDFTTQDRTPTIADTSTSTQAAPRRPEGTAAASRNRSTEFVPAPRPDSPTERSSTTRSAPSDPGKRQRESSLVIIGGNRSRSAGAPATTSPGSTSRTIDSAPRPTATQPSASTQPDIAQSRPRTEAAATARSVRGTSPSPTLAEPGRSPARVTAPARQSPGVTRTTPSYTPRPDLQSFTRPPMNNRVPSTTPSVRSQPAPRPSLTAPPQRGVAVPAPNRTFSAPSQPARPSPAPMTPSPSLRSTPSYSPSSSPGAPSSSPAAGVAPPGRGGERPGGRSR